MDTDKFVDTLILNGKMQGIIMARSILLRSAFQGGSEKFSDSLLDVCKILDTEYAKMKANYNRLKREQLYGDQNALEKATQS